MKVIELDNVSKYYPLYQSLKGGFRSFLFNISKGMEELKSHSFKALENVSFSVEEGESVGIIGKNGAGKSSILGMIAGVIKPNEGSIKVRKRVSPLLQLGGGFNRNLSGRENILLNGVLLGFASNFVRQKMKEIIEFSELGKFIDEELRVYSNGMIVKLGFSIVTLLNPELILVDEILAVGDKEFQKKCINVINEFRKKGVTIVLVSHNMSEIKNVCDRVIWIENHVVKMDGPAKEVITKYSND